jgi:hypothetical protein
MGPVQVLVVGFEQPKFSGEVLAEFARLRQAGVVRLLDVLLVERDGDGRIDTLDIPGEFGTDAGALAAALLGQRDDSSTQPSSEGPSPSWSLDHAVPAGSFAAIALIEHVWATPLVAAMHRAGGTPLDETWLAAEDVARLEELTANPAS